MGALVAPILASCASEPTDRTQWACVPVWVEEVVVMSCQIGTK